MGLNAIRLDNIIRLSSIVRLSVIRLSEEQRRKWQNNLFLKLLGHCRVTNRSNKA